MFTSIYIYTLMDNVSYPQIVYIDSMFYSSYSCFDPIRDFSALSFARHTFVN